MAATDDVVVEVGGARQRRLLGTLVAHANQIVSTDRLADIVFQGEPPAGATTTMRSYVARLRRALGDAEPGADELIITGRGGYGLQIDTGQIDAERFEASIETARRQLTDRDPVAAAETLRSGLSLWRGEAYGEFGAEDWAHAEATRLAELRTVTAEELNDALLACGLAHDVVTATRAQIEDHPLRERLRAQHMLALYRAGRQVEALRALDDFQRVLVDVGLEPSEELADLGRSIAAHDPALRLDSPAGQPLRGYRIGSPLGEGAHGVVYRAIQPGVGREVAIKTIRAQLANDPVFVRRFDAEAQLVANLEHPHIAPIYDYWREPGGAYIVMRLLAANLDQRLAAGPADVETAATTALQLGSALATAHRVGVVHGDIKASNVLVDADNTYLADFGVATLAGTARDGEEVAASSGYESPEILHGEPPTPASDQFALAVLFVHLLTGTLPFGRRAIATRHDRSPSIHVQRPSVPASVDDVISRATAWEPDERYPDVETFVDEFVAALGGRSRPDRPDRSIVNPYKGLRAFTEADRSDFFGRSEAVDELVDLLGRSGQAGQLVVAVGASGCGKSSVMRAGLVPSLRSGAVAGSSDWLIATMVPGADPFAELDVALRSIAIDDPGDAPTSPDDGALVRTLDVAVPADQTVLLVIDQLEELFTLVADEEIRSTFLAALVRALAERGPRLRVVATLRADVLDRPLRYARFGRLLKDGAVTIVGMSAPELESAVTQPAARVGVEVEPALATQLVADVIDQPAALPLLEFTLTQLFEARSGRVMTLEGYRRLGGVDAAVAASAEERFTQFSERDRELARRMFLRLIAVDDSQTISSRRVLRSDLISSSDDRAEMEEIVSAFGTARLLAFDRDPVTREPTVEIAHEALIRHWPRFAAWVAEAGDGLRIQAHVAEAARAWDRQGRDEGDLLRGLRLDGALEWATSHPETLSPLEHELVDASDAARRALLAAERERAELQRRANLRLRGGLIGVGVLLIAALVAGFLAVRQRDQARSATERAELATLISRSAAATADDPELSLLLALEAHRRSPEAETEQAVLNALGGSRLPNQLDGFSSIDDDTCDLSTFVSDGGRFEYAIVDGRYLSQDLTTGEVVDYGPTPTPCGVWVGDPETDRVVSTFDFGERTWIGTFDEPTRIELEPLWGTPMFIIPNEETATLATDRVLVKLPRPDGDLLAMFDATTGEPIGEPFGDGTWWGVAVHPDGSLLAVGFALADAAEGGGQLQVLDARTAEERYRVDTGVHPRAFAFDEATGELIAALTDGTLLTLDADTGEILAKTATSATADIFEIAVRPDGLVTAVSFGQVDVVDRRTGPVAPPTELRDFDWAEVRDDGTVLLQFADGRHQLVDPAGTALVERTWQIDPFSQVSFNAGQAGVVSRSLAGPREVIDLATGTRSSLPTSGGNARAEPAAIYPEDEGYWALTPASELILWVDGQPVERIGLGGELFTATRFEDWHALVVRPPGGEAVVRLVDVDPDAAGIVFTIPAPEASTAIPTLHGGVHVIDFDGTVNTYDRSGELTGVIETGARDVIVITLDPTTGTLGVISWDGVVVLVDTETGRLRELPRTGAAGNLGFADDGELLVITGRDGTVRIWDLERDVPAGIVWEGTGAVPSSPSWYDESTSSVWVSTSGRLLQIPLDPQRWIERACEIVGRELTEDELDRLVPGDGPPQPACPTAT